MGLYPSAQTSQETLDATDQFLGTLDDESRALRRLVLEARDGVLRALAAQGADQ